MKEENLREAGGKEPLKAAGHILFVAADSNPRKVAGAAAAMVKETGSAELRAVGNRAVSAEVKAAVIARSFLDLSGIRIETIPSFFAVTLADEERRGVRMMLCTRSLKGCTLRFKEPLENEDK